jgi:hypothetical protein
MAQWRWIAEARSLPGYGMPSRGQVLDLDDATAASLLIEGKIEPVQPPRPQPITTATKAGRG